MSGRMTVAEFTMSWTSPGLSNQEVREYLGLDFAESLVSPGLFGPDSLQLFVFSCNNVSDSATNPCITGLNVTVTPFYPADPTAPGANTSLVPDIEGSSYAEYGNRTLDLIRRRCDKLSFCDEFDANDTSIYVYGVRYYDLCPVATLCGRDVWVQLDANGEDVWFPLPDFDAAGSIAIRHPFNGSTIAYREMYGVPAEYQGIDAVVQGTSLDTLSALPTDQVYSYLDALNITYKDLVYAFGEENDESLCGDGQDCTEQLLDVTTMMGMAPLAFNIYLPLNVNITLENLAQQLNRLVTQIESSERKVDVISWSWGYDYPDSFPSLDAFQTIIDEIEKPLEKLAKMNVTIVVGPGDNGASGTRAEEGCVSRAQGGLFQTWPGMSPWVVSVGGTDMQVIEKGGSPQEVVMYGLVDGTTTAGGFSAKEYGYTTPEWQKAAVQAYLDRTGPGVFKAFPNKKDTPAFNPTGRAFPDIAAFGSGQMLVGEDGEVEGPQTGTSLSAPIIASLFTLANQKLIEQGYEKIGYANPMIYWMGENCPEAFTDVVYGNNTASEDDTVCAYGYPATPGWDAVSGWGTINFEPFVDCAIKYQKLGKKPEFPDQDGTQPSSSSHHLVPFVLFVSSLLFFYSQEA